jgi:hypothetical protein
MKLTYRGVTYDRQSEEIEMNEGEVGGKYRGNQWKYHYPRHIPTLQPKLAKKYRGIAYDEQKGSCDTGEYAIASYLNSPQRRKVINSEAANIHLENMRQNLERRIKAAEASGNLTLMDLLKDESRQLELRM